MVEPLRHRQTKEAATDMLDLKSPRHTSTLPDRTSVHEMFLRGEPCSVWAWLSKLGGVRQSDPVHRLLMICE